MIALFYGSMTLIPTIVSAAQDTMKTLLLSYVFNVTILVKLVLTAVHVTHAATFPVEFLM